MNVDAEGEVREGTTSFLATDSSIGKGTIINVGV